MNAKNTEKRVDIGLVMGDAAGIGPEIAIKTITDSALDADVSVIVLGSVPAMETMNGLLGNPVDIVPVAPEAIHAPTPSAARPIVRVIDCDTAPNPAFEWGKANGVNGANTVNAIRRSFEIASEFGLDGIVIGPLDKKAMNLGGSRFPDEMALMQSLTGVELVKNVVKWNNIFRSSVVGHVRFTDIVANLTPEKVERTVTWLAEAMRLFGFEKPRIGVAALNPHAGEGGEFGDEEARILSPVIAKFAGTDLEVSGPYPSDTILNRAINGQFEGIVFLFHDQGNIAQKAASFGEAVLIYRGLPLPVTGVGHGVAYGRAGQGRADHTNLLVSVKAAAEMARMARG